MKPGGSSRIRKGSTITIILSLMNPIPRIDIYLLEIHSNIGLPYMPAFLKVSFLQWFQLQRSADDVVETTKGLQERTQLIEWDDGEA